MDKDFIKSLLIDFIIGIIVCAIIVGLCLSVEVVSAAEIVSTDNVSQVVSDNTISGNYVSGNVVSGNFVTYDQGETIIQYLRFILFILVFSFCFERVRNGIRSLNKTR